MAESWWADGIFFRRVQVLELKAGHAVHLMISEQSEYLRHYSAVFLSHSWAVN
jgi:hypothetical protein